MTRCDSAFHWAAFWAYEAWWAVATERGVVAAGCETEAVAVPESPVRTPAAASATEAIPRPRRRAGFGQAKSIEGRAKTMWALRRLPGELSGSGGKLARPRPRGARWRLHPKELVALLR